MLRNKINLKLWVAVVQLGKNYSYLFNLITAGDATYKMLSKSENKIVSGNSMPICNLYGDNTDIYANIMMLYNE